MNKLVIILSFLITTTSYFSLAQDEFTVVKTGEQVPDFTINLEDGSTLKIAELKGKVVWINFFATWCGPCLAELPHLEKEVYQEFGKHNDFEVMVIGREHDWKTVNNFRKSKNYEMPFYPDPERKIYSKFAGQYIPRNFIIDKEGKIVVSSIGFTENEFDELVKKLKTLLQN